MIERMQAMEAMQTTEQHLENNSLAAKGNRQDNNTKWKIITIITSVLAICGIVFGVCAMVNVLQQNQQIQSLKSQLEECGLVDIEECGLVDIEEYGQGTVPDGYIAVFHGGGAEVTRETYIYKEDNDQANYGFTYINTETIWGINPENATTKILKRGSFDWTDGAFTVAEENNAYTYVTTPNSNQVYTIEEFMSRFLMN